MNLNERIVNLCEKRGISQSKLEKDLKIAKGSVTKWKTQEPRHSTLEKIADYFGVSVDYLMTGKKKEIPSATETDDFVNLIDFYNSSNVDGQKRIMEYARMIAKEFKK